MVPTLRSRSLRRTLLHASGFSFFTYNLEHRRIGEHGDAHRRAKGLGPTLRDDTVRRPLALSK
jgi:hypothetical protein